MKNHASEKELLVFISFWKRTTTADKQTHVQYIGRDGTAVNLAGRYEITRQKKNCAGTGENPHNL